LQYHARVQRHDFAYDLPPDLIAQTPLAERSASRLLVLDQDPGHDGGASAQDVPASDPGSDGSQVASASRPKMPHHARLPQPPAPR
jgi:hypothetical protein